MKEGFTSRDLNECFWFQEGPGVRKWQFKDSGIKLLNVSNIVKGGGIDLGKTDRHLSVEEATGKYSHFLIDDGDLVIASSGISIDDDSFLRTRASFIENHHLPLCMNTSTIRFKAIEGVSDLRFLKHWIDSIEFRTQITKEVTGIAQKNFGPSHLNRIKISLPSLPEQKRIAAILDKADEIRQKRRQAIAKLDELLQATFLDMFGDPVTNPKRWDQGVLGDVVYSAKDGPHVSPKYSEEGIPFLSTRHVKPGKIEWKDLKYLSRNEAEIQWKKCKPEKGDVLYTKGGTTGLAAHIDFDKDIAVWVHVALLKTNHELVHPVWLESMLNSHYCYVQSQKYTHGIANRDLGLKRMIKIKLHKPPISEQMKFVNFYKKHRAESEAMISELRTLDTLFSSLQQRAFKGEL